MIQIVMASRVIYGLADAGRLPAILAVLNPRTRTPLAATALIAAAILALALCFPLGLLAERTSQVILVVFAMINLALVRLKRRGVPPPQTSVVVPMVVPILGFLTSVGMLVLSAF